MLDSLLKPRATAPSPHLWCFNSFFCFLNKHELQPLSVLSWRHKYSVENCSVCLWVLWIRVVRFRGVDCGLRLSEGMKDRTRHVTRWGPASSSGTLASRGEEGGADGSRPSQSRRWTTAGRSAYRSWWYGQPDPSTHLEDRKVFSFHWLHSLEDILQIFQNNSSFRLQYKQDKV